jgi:hypothetical protein
MIGLLLAALSAQLAACANVEAGEGVEVLLERFVYH